MNRRRNTAFKVIKKIVAGDVILHYPDFAKQFEINTDCSNYQIGAIINQGERLVTYWSKKFTESQHKHPTTDQEFLAIVECLKQYKTVLLDKNIVIWTDHRNLTYENTEHASDRVLRQRLLLE